MARGRENVLQRLYRKFVLVPAGYGRPIPPAAADHEYASGAWGHFDSPEESQRYLALADAVHRRHPGGAVLDVGCGTGRFELLLAPHQPRRCVGVDFSTEAIRRARIQGLTHCDFLEGDFESWRPGETFDAIVFNEVLGYARDPGAVVAAFLPSLAESGHVYISHFRFGPWPAMWRRVEKHCSVIETSLVTNQRGDAWDIKVLQPRPAPR